MLLNTTRRRLPLWAALTTTLVLGAALPSAAATVADRAAAERAGEEITDHPARVVDRSLVLRGGIDLLLVPESTNDAVMAFDPVTGDLVDAAFIPADPDNLSTPIQAILSASGDSILVSDQLDDVVQEYDLDGNYLGVFAPAGGANTAIADNIRGISLTDSGNLLVAVASGTNADAIAEFDTAGNYIDNLVANGEGGLDGPWAVLLDGAGALYSTGDGSDRLQEFDATSGAFVADLEDLDNFPEQANLASNGNILVSVFLGADTDIVEVAADGTRIANYDIPEVGGSRGVYELGNGNLLVTDGAGVHEVTRTTGELVETKIDGVSARLISRVTIGGGGGPTLTLTGMCPGELTLEISGGTPNGSIGLLRGTAAGSDVLAGGPCAGTGTGLENVAFLTALPLDGSGGATITRTLTENSCGMPLQAIDPNGCVTSNVDFLP